MSGLALIQAKPRFVLSHSAQILAVGLSASIPLSNSLTTALSLLLAIALMLQLNTASLKMIARHPLTHVVLALVALACIAAVYSHAEPVAVRQALRKSLRLLYIPLLLPLFSQALWRHAAAIAYLAAVTVSVLAALWYGDGVFKDPIFTSLFTAFAIFMLAHYSVSYKSVRKFAIPLAMLFTYYLFFVGTGRSGQLLFFALFLLFVWQRVPRNTKTLGLAALAIISLLVASILLPSSFVRRQTLVAQELQQYLQNDVRDIPNTSSLGMRLILAQNAWQVIKLNPLLGWGTGSYSAVFAKFAENPVAKNEFGANPHNQYLLTWVELGLPGLICLVYLFVTCARVFMREPNLEGYLGLGLTVAFAIGCSMNSWLLDFASTFFFVVLVAVFAGAQTRA